MEKNIIFLVGAPRSGTTWLQLMLSAVPEIVTVNETHLFSWYTSSMFSSWRLLVATPRQIGLNFLMNEGEYYGLIGQFVRGVFDKIIETKPNAFIVLEKTPDHVQYWPDILNVLPNARFLHMIRDPRAVVSSMAAANRSWGSSWTSAGITDNCARWIADVEAGRRIAQRTPDYLEVRYEDLKENGSRTLQSTLAWCGVEISLSRAKEIIEEYRIDRLRAGETEETPWPLAGEPTGFFRKGEANSWKKELSRRQVALIESMAGSLMSDLGYAPAFGTNPFWRYHAALEILLLHRARRALLSRLIRLGRMVVPTEMQDALRTGRALP